MTKYRIHRWTHKRQSGSDGLSPVRFHRWIRIFLFSNAISWCTAVSAQDTAKEIWPEIDAWLRLSPRWRLSVFVPISSNLETKYREGNFIAQADYLFGRQRKLHLVRLYDDNRAQSLKPFMVRTGYLSGRSLGDDGEAYNENMAFLELHLRTPLKGNVLISHRLRPEARWIGDDDVLSYRFRYRLMIEKEFSGRALSWVPYVNVEPYYDSRYETVNRVRAIGGTTVSWSSWYMFEGNFTYQHDSRSSVTNLYAFNIIVHLFLETKHSKKMRSKQSYRLPQLLYQKPGKASAA
jgi:hypothetical protein